MILVEILRRKLLKQLKSNWNVSICCWNRTETCWNHIFFSNDFNRAISISDHTMLRNWFKRTGVTGWFQRIQTDFNIFFNIFQQSTIYFQTIWAYFNMRFQRIWSNFNVFAGSNKMKKVEIQSYFNKFHTWFFNLFLFQLYLFIRVSKFQFQHILI